MIQVTCSNCTSRFNAADNTAGRTAKCPNCGSPIAVPGVAPPPPVPPPVPSASAYAMPAPGIASTPGATTVVIQMQAPPADTIGPANKSGVAVFLLWFFVPISGVHYFYLGQTGKGLVAVLLDLFLFIPVIIFTCGLGLLLFIPWHTLLLIDGLVVCNRLRTQAISTWRCF